MTTEVVLTASAQMLANEAVRILADARELTITTPDQYQQAARLVQSVKGLAKRLEDERFSQTRPLDDEKKAIIELYRPLADTLTQAEGVIKRGISAYQQEQQRIAREAQAKLDEQARKQREKLEEQARAAREKAAADAAKLREAGEIAKAERVEERAEMRAETLEQRADVVAAPVVAMDTPKIAGVVTRQVWKFEITDPRLLPREYLMPDESKIRRIVGALKGDTAISGVRVWPEDSIAVGAQR